MGRLILPRQVNPDRINIHDAYELGFWTTKLNISSTLLKQAVKEVGPQLDDIRLWLYANEPAEA